MITKPLILSILLFVFYSCSKENESINTVVEPIQELKWEVNEGGLLFNWKNPNATDFSYVEILYKDPEGGDRRILVQGGRSSQEIYGLPTADTIDFTFKSYNTSEIPSKPLTVGVAPKMPTYLSLLETVRVLLNLDGVEVRWNNPSGKEHTIQIEYVDALGVLREQDIVVVDAGVGARQVNITGVLKADLVVSTEDQYGNTSTSREFLYKKLEQGKFDREIWEIVDFSSEEAGGEGAFPQGYTAALIDGAKNTFWHSKWSNLPPGYVPGFPQHVTFDLQRTVQLDSAEFIQRHNKSMAGKIILEGSNVGKSGPWEMIVESSLTVGNGATNMVVFEQSYNYRFVKMSVTEKGVDAKFSALAEFALFGQDIVEE